MSDVDTTLTPEQMDPEVRHVYDKILPIYNRCGHETQSIIMWLFCTWQIERNAGQAMAAELNKHVLFHEALDEELAADKLEKDKQTLADDLPNAGQPTAN